MTGATVAVVVTVVVSAAALGWRRGGAPDGSTVDLGDRPDGLVPITELDWPVGDVGECLVQRADRLDPTPCGDPHDLQRIASGSLDVDDVTTFDASEVRGEVRSRCADAFESFVGVSVPVSMLDAPFTAPSAASWPQGDRVYQCFVGVSGRRVTGDAGGAER